MTVRSQFPAFQTRADPPLLVAGELRLPPLAEGQRTGAVLICHGSDGVDGRGAALAEVLNARGLATFEIDMWAARGVKAIAFLQRYKLPKVPAPDQDVAWNDRAA